MIKQLIRARLFETILIIGRADETDNDITEIVYGYTASRMHHLLNSCFLCLGIHP